MVETVTPGDCRGQIIYRVFIGSQLRGWEGRKTNQIAPPEMNGLSIDRKLKYTDLIDLANVDGVGSDPVLRFSGPTTTHNHSYE